MTLLAEVVSTSRSLADTSSRSAKIAILADLLRRLDGGEVAIAVGFLVGAPRQGRVGIGYSTVYGIERPPVGEPTLFTGELRQGALAGLMVDAVAKAAGVPATITRRALMLSGDLTRTAEIAIAEG